MSFSLNTSKVGVVGLAFRPIEVIRVYVSIYKHARHHGQVIWTCLSPLRFFQFFNFLVFSVCFIKNLIFPKLRLFFNILIGKIDFVIKVGQIIGFSHVGAHFQAKSTQCKSMDPLFPSFEWSSITQIRKPQKIIY